MACRFPDAPTPAALWQNILECRASFQEVADQRWTQAPFVARSRDPNGTHSRKVAFVEGVGDFAARHFGISPRRAESMDTQQRLMLEVVREALCDAGLERRPFARRLAATFVGAGVSEYSRIMVNVLRVRQMAAGDFGARSDQAGQLCNRIVSSRSYTIPGSLLSMCASVVAQTFDLGGPAMAVDAACASSLMAVVQGVRYLRDLPAREGGAAAAPIALAGGVYLIMVPDNMVGFARIGALARDSCRPFDAAAQGFLIGEGVGMLVLKRLSDAVLDGDRVYAVIRGVAWNSDGRMDSPMTPRLSGQVELLQAGLADAGLQPGDIDYLECHGTGTLIGDEAELKALCQVYADVSHGPRLGSIKANIGHTLSAAGVAGLMRAALAVYHGVLPPQAGWDAWPAHLAEQGARFTIDKQPAPWSGRLRRATVSAFGFGGTNAFAVLEEAPSREVPTSEGARAPLLFCCGAPTPTLLDQYLEALVPCLETLDAPGLAAAAHTLTHARELGRYAVVFVACDATETVRCIRELQAALEQPPARLTRVGPSALLGPVTEEPALVTFLFPGQAERRPLEFEALWARFPAGPAPRVESPPGGDPWADSHYGDALFRTELALASLLEGLGVKSSLLIGHSMGEAAASTWGGWLEADLILEHALTRSLAIERAVTARGGMLVARLAVEQARSRAEELGLHLAGMNHPQQALLAGDRDTLEKAEQRLREDGVPCQRLGAAHPFHSPLMREAEPEVRRLAELLPVSATPPRARVITTVGGIAPLEYHADPEWIRELWRVQATRPVEFEPAVRLAAESVPALWLELGPGNGLCQCVQATLGGPDLPPPLVISVGEPRAELANLLLALGAASVLGHVVALEEAFPPHLRVLADLPFMPLERERYWAVAPPPASGAEPVALEIEQVIERGALRTAPQATVPAHGGAPVAAEPGSGILHELMDVVAQVAAWPRTRVRPGHRLRAHLGLDSLALVDLASQFVRRFGSLPGEETWRHDPTLAEMAESLAMLGGRPPDVLLRLDTHPFLADHAIEGRPFLPLVSALDLMAWSEDLEPPWALRDVRVGRGVMVRGQARLRVSRDGRTIVIHEVRPTGRAVKAFEARLPLEVPTEPPPAGEEGEPKALDLGLDDFYRDHTFHGPRLRGVAEVTGRTTKRLEGWVRTSLPQDWQPFDRRSRWHLDPLTMEGCLHLALYWGFVALGKSLLPTSIEEVVLLRPLEAGPVRVRIDLLSVDDDEVCSHMHLFQGEARVGWLRGVRARVVAPFTPARPVILPEENWRVEAFPEVRAMEERLHQVEGANPYFLPHEGIPRAVTVFDGRETLCFSHYNYLGLNGHPEVSAAAQEATVRHGTSVSASRLVAGELPLHLALEAELADFLGCEACVTMVGGHATNVTTISRLVGPSDLVLHDALIHDSVIQGAIASRAGRRAFPHNDMPALERILREVRTDFRRVLLVAEGVYSMDGDVCDLPALVALKERHGGLLMVDEAHSLGVLGARGRGVAEHFGIEPARVDVWMGTLSKTLASCGGYIAGSHGLVRFLKYAASGFIYSVGMPPASTAAGLAALRILRREPQRVARLRENACLFLEEMKTSGCNVGLAQGTSVVPVILGSLPLSFSVTAALMERGIHVMPIVYPAVEESASRLRFFITSEHTPEQLRHTAAVVRETLASHGVGSPSPAD